MVGKGMLMIIYFFVVWSPLAILQRCRRIHFPPRCIANKLVLSRVADPPLSTPPLPPSVSACCYCPQRDTPVSEGAECLPVCPMIVLC